MPSPYHPGSEPTPAGVESGPGDRLPDDVPRSRLGQAVSGARDAFPIRAMDRAADSRRVDGNLLKLQFEGPATFDAWIEAIEEAERYVHFENYILRDDRVGRIFREVLIEKALDGVQVRVLHDWVGCWATGRRYWKPFHEAGVEVRAFNPPSVRDPFGLLQRDHRKLVCVDGKVAFVGGFCIGEEWAGTEEDPPWRDTGVEIRGPAAAASARAFEDIWDEIGPPVPEALRTRPSDVEPRGTTPVWLLEGRPWRTRVYRATQLVASNVQERLWITDPYFVAPRPVTQALMAAARDGVDVRILVPGHNNWPLVGSLSRGGYRDLLRAGIRIFEWQGPMIHAKTGVADGIWCRIGSSNLNAASLLGNWEIDVGVLDEGLASQLEGLFLADLASAREIVLPGGTPLPVLHPLQGREGAEADERRGIPLGSEGSLQERMEHWRRAGGSTGWSLADLVRAGTTFSDAIAGHRVLGPEDRTVLGTAAVLVLIVAVVAAVFPSFVGWAVAGVTGWFGIVLAVRAVNQARRARLEDPSVHAPENGVERTEKRGVHADAE